MPQNDFVGGLVKASFEAQPRIDTRLFRIPSDQNMTVRSACSYERHFTSHHPRR